MRGETRFVSYLRVSTARQGSSGLGLEAQRAAVSRFLDGGNATLIEEFVEVESGKNPKRPKLAAALASCRIHGAVLVVAKLDRLSRNASFLLSLQDAGVRFVAADNPQVNEMVVGVLAVVAQYEGKMISERTRAALAAAKARGVKLGSPMPLSRSAQAKGTTASLESRRIKAAQFTRDVLPRVQEAYEIGRNLARTAEILNEQKIPARRGGSWNPNQVLRVLRSAGS
jgi:DNA invertase Pin-like site-specific DNA recombinase